MENKPFKVKSHSYQIGDTGDYDGYWEITNGEISLCTKDDGDEIDKMLGDVAKVINETKIHFYVDNAKEIDLHFECDGLKIQLKEQAAHALEREKVLVDALRDIASGKVLPQLIAQQALASYKEKEK